MHMSFVIHKYEYVRYRYVGPCYNEMITKYIEDNSPLFHNADLLLDFGQEVQVAEKHGEINQIGRGKNQLSSPNCSTVPCSLYN